ncbi:MAG TPA: polyprenyl synthetase family protein [Gracilimonas sp.]|uniref:polyprenyl synthetase family protein n=1 Tax=Gracilimonas sp. TaxID=1974203 RepID=UPI002D8EBD40|nr:polyprenyl synthetase family protein [Gracilimonas sp.]
MSKTDLQQLLLDKIETGLKEIDLPVQPKTLYEPYRYALSAGGKRIRPMLTLLACGLCEGNPEDALPAALAVEILHNFTLVHDDIMDSADTRRGEPSVFKKWSENIAILSGDVMFADAYKKLSYYGHSDEYSKHEFAAMHDVFVKAIITVCEGQALDMEFVERLNVSHEEYIQMIAGKTAALLSGALEMGAISAHSTNQKRKELAELGYEMGIAFQIQDDLLDATADPEKFGKRPGGDIFEGKKTYLTILALERANSAQATLIEETLDQEKPNDEQVDQVLSIMKELNVLSDVADEVEQHYQKAFQLLNKFRTSDYQQELEKLLIFLQNRDH